MLDSSAWLAHLFAEPGVREVAHLFGNAEAEVFLCALSIPEVNARVKARGEPDRWPAVWEAYQPLFRRILPVDEAVALRAVELRGLSWLRIPTVDCLIAATASLHRLTLVHRDPHLALFPQEAVATLRLPDKVSP